MTTLDVEGIPTYYAEELRANPLPETLDPQEDGYETPIPPVGDISDTPYDDPASAAADAPPEQIGSADSYAFVYTVTTNAYGNRDNLYTFLAQVAPMTAMHVVYFDFTDPVTTRDADGKSITTPGQINMVIKMYVLIDGVPARDFGAPGY